MRTSVCCPLVMLVTRTMLPNGKVRCAATGLIHIVNFTARGDAAVEWRPVPGGDALFHVGRGHRGQRCDWGREREWQAMRGCLRARPGASRRRSRRRGNRCGRGARSGATGRREARQHQQQERAARRAAWRNLFAVAAFAAKDLGRWHRRNYSAFGAVSDSRSLANRSSALRCPAKHAGRLDPRRGRNLGVDQIAQVRDLAIKPSADLFENVFELGHGRPFTRHVCELSAARPFCGAAFGWRAAYLFRYYGSVL